MSGYWTRDRIIDALQVWAERHGRTPTKMRDWRHGTPDHPAAPTVDNVFGSWNAAIVAAGLTPNKPGSPTVWTPAAIVAALLDWLCVRGKWPTKNTWRAAGMQPSPETIEVVCGSWDAARRMAGWTRRCRHCTGPLRGRQRLWCSDKCRQNAGRATPKVTGRSRCCVACGVDHDVFTHGCIACANRKQVRARRAAAKSGVSLRVVESTPPLADSDAGADGEIGPGRPVTQAAAAA